MSVVTLSWFEFSGAVEVGLRRFEQSCARGMNPASTYDRSWMRRLADDVIGAAGERAFCKWSARYWDGSVNTFHGVPDVGRSWEVRTTQDPDGCLIVRDNDAPDRWYVLVLADPPRFLVRGWIYGADARKPEYVRNPGARRPSWFVPQHALLPTGETDNNETEETSEHDDYEDKESA